MAIEERPSRAGDLKQAISDAVVRISSDFVGRGPTRAKTYINGHVVCCVMQDLLTQGERSLVADGQREAVREMRRRFQDGMRVQLCGAVQDLTGRQVVSFLSDNDVVAETAIEAFLLDGAIAVDGSVTDGSRLR
jgi:uncharacterized protein YbcI